MASLDRLGAIVPKALQDDFSATIKRVVGDNVTPGGTITGSVFKDAESELGRLTRMYSGKQSGAEQLLSDAYRQAQAELRQAVARSNPDVAPQIQAINAGWANLVQLERAAARVGAKDGIITPAQYLSAIKASDASVRDRAFARGTALNQDFAQAADKVLSKTIPDSGTALRGMVGAGLGGAAAHFVNPLAPAAGGIASLAYTPLGQRAIAGLLTKRPKALQDLGGYSGLLSAPLISGLLAP